jgi:hypothetical protein
MEWIIDEVGGYYFDNMGGSEHLSDLDTLEQRGKAHGGRYP